MSNYLLGFGIGVFVGIIMTTMWWIWLPNILTLLAIMREKRDAKKPVDFRKMPNPPDQGIEQRIYKAKGTPAEISRHALGRRHKDR